MIDFKKQMKLSYIVPDVLFFQSQINSWATLLQKNYGAPTVILKMIKLSY